MRKSPQYNNVINNQMVFVLLVSVPFADPLPSLYWWAVSVGVEELKWHQLARNRFEGQSE